MPNSVNLNGILLDEPLVIEHHREPQLTEDQADYLVTAHLLQVTGTYNPATNAFSGPPPVADSTSLPGSTLMAIRHQLEQPQGKLQYTDGTQKVLDIQGPDARNGPFVKVHDIVEQMGSQTYLVSVSVLTYMNEVKFFAPVSPILSHRYQSFDDYDEDTYLSRTIHGYAEFRSDALKAVPNAVPDQYRAYLWHPCPPGFKLDLAHVDVDSDGLTLDYTLVFRQKPIIVAIPGVTRVEMFDSFTTGRANPADYAIGIAQGVASLNAWSTFSTGLGIAPSFNRRAHIRVWGYPTSNKQYLTGVGVKILNARWQGQQNNLNNVTVTHDVMGRYVELIYERSLGGFAGIWESLIPGAGGADGLPNDAISREVNNALKVFVGKPDDCWWANGVIVDTNVNPNASGPHLPNDPTATTGQGCRGSYLGQLVMAALLGTAPPQKVVTPPRPALPPAIKSLVPAGGK